LISGVLSGMILIYAIPEQQMTLSIDELFEIVTKTIAEPNTTITEQDLRKTIRVFIGFDDYLIDALPGYCEEGCEIDFGGYAAGILDELEGK
jgi:hypothetical protein